MALNVIFVGFFLVAFVVALLRVILYYNRDFFEPLFGIELSAADGEVFSAIVKSTFDMAETSVSISIYLVGVMTLWLGIMRIGESAGAIRILSRLVAPFFRKLFPDLPKDHPALGTMMMNFSANMLGLDNAATPMGLKAMKELQSLNSSEDTASNSQIMFLVLNTSGLTLIPISVMAIRGAQGAVNPSDVFLPILLATFVATLAGLIAVSIVQKINLFHPVVLAYLGGISLAIWGLIFYMQTLPQESVAEFSSLVGNGLLFGIIISFLLMGLKARINIYEQFIEGAKEGFQVAIGIIPYLVAMLVAIGVFRASGALDFLEFAVRSLVELLGINSDFVPALPTAFMKPLSGSGARGAMIEAMTNHGGADSFVGRLASTLQGSTETTFYTLAVYYGAVKIKNTRHTLGCGLIADFAGIVAAIIIAYYFFH